MQQCRYLLPAYTDTMMGLVMVVKYSTHTAWRRVVPTEKQRYKRSERGKKKKMICQPSTDCVDTSSVTYCASVAL